MSGFNETVRWSRLARFGKSKLATLTIVTPFLGFLIFLNSGLEEYVVLGPTDLPDGWLKYLADRRVEILYLGLSLLGAATGLFSLLAPDTIKSSDQYSDYIQFKEDTKTENAVAGSLETSLSECNLRRGRLESSFHDIAETWDFPENLKSSIYRLVVSVFERSEHFETPSGRNKDELDDEISTYYMYNGIPDIDPIFDCVVSCRRVEFGIWKSFYSVASDFSIDVFRLEYLRKDYSNPIMRIIVFGMFVCGSAVALFPTLVSVWMVFLLTF